MHGLHSFLTIARVLAIFILSKRKNVSVRYRTPGKISLRIDFDRLPPDVRQCDVQDSGAVTILDAYFSAARITSTRMCSARERISRMDFIKFALAIIASGIGSSATDWFFTGVLFHDRYDAHPEVWRSPGGAAETRAVILSVTLSFCTCAAFVLSAWTFNITGFGPTLLFAFCIWLCGSLPLVVTNSFFIKLHPLIVLSNSIGWLVKLSLAAIATVLFVD